MLKKGKIIFILCVGTLIILQILLIRPFFHTGFFPSHDDVQVVRIFEMFQDIKYGGFPPRWSSGLLFGHGYPLFNFYAPLTYLLGALLVFTGANFLVATKVVFISSFFIGVLGMYVLVKRLMGDIPAFISAVVFSLVPYRAVDVYVRGALPEFFAYSLFPWVLWANLNIYNQKNSSRIFLFSLLLAILILTHSISGFVFGAYLLLFNIYMFIVHKKERLKNFLIYLKSMALGIGLSAFYWLPLIYEIKFVNLSTMFDYPYQKYFLTLPQIWDSPWGFGGFHGSDPMSLQLGKVIIIGSAAALLLNLLIKTKLRSLVFFLGITMALFIFLEIKRSFFIWNTISFLPLIQFPWRYHIVITVCGSILVGACIYLLQNSEVYKKFFGKYLLTVFVIVIVVLALKESVLLFKPRLYYEGTFVAETTTWDDEYMPLWVKNKPKDITWPSERVKLDGRGTISDIEWGYWNKKFTANITRDSSVRIAHIYYPGWVARVNGIKSEIYYNNPSGFMTIKLPQGKSVVTINFERTWWRILSELISIGSGFYIIIAFLRKNNLLVKTKLLR